MGMIAVLVLAICAHGGGFQQDSESLLSQGLSLIRSGDFEGAVEKLRESIRANPASTAAHYNLALALLRLQKNSDAIEELQKVTALAPQIAPAHYNLALLLEESGRLPDAIEQLRAFRALNPGDPAGLVHLISDYFKTGDSTKALSLAREALAQSQEMKVQAQLGMLLAQNGQAREALQPLENVLRSAPDAVAVMPYLGRAYLEAGQAEKALTVLHQALRLNPDEDPASVTLNLLLGVAEADLHGAAAARPYIEKALRLDPQSALGHNVLGNLFLRVGNYEAAEKSYKEAAELAPTNDLYAYDVALALERMNRVAEAISYAETAARLKPGRGITHYMLGKLYTKVDRNADAIRELETCIRLDPKADASYYLLARTYRKLADNAQAERWMTKLTELKTAQDRRIGLSGPATQSTSLLDAPAPWDRTP
jgi:tetratricopeptide (TPR) repeat protein